LDVSMVAHPFAFRGIEPHAIAYARGEGV